jgi:hypothetical protein
MALSQPSPSVDLAYSIGRDKQNNYLVISRKGHRRLYAADAGELLLLFDNDLSIALQRMRSDLFFLHAASPEAQGRGMMLVGPSGSGKSTMTWALLHDGFRYLSDELSPVDLKTLEIYSFSHALCLKSEPPAPYRLPAGTLRTPRALYVPVDQLPGAAADSPVPLKVIFFLQYCPQIGKPEVRPITRGTAAARLYSNALNPLAHSGEGLDAVIHIAKRSACFELYSTDLAATCKLIKDVMKNL